MSKKNKGIKLEKDESLYDSSIDDIKYETVERNKDTEKANIAYANSWRGHFVSGVDRLTDKLWAFHNKCYIFSKRKLVDFWTFSIKSLDILRVFLYNEYCNKILRKDKKIMSNTNDTTTTKSTKNTKSKAQNTTPVETKSRWDSTKHGIMGIMTLFVIVSIAYSSWVIVQGTDDPIHRIMLVPMVAWAAVKLIQQFIKRGDK